MQRDNNICSYLVWEKNRVDCGGMEWNLNWDNIKAKVKAISLLRNEFKTTRSRLKMYGTELNHPSITKYSFFNETAAEYPQGTLWNLEDVVQEREREEGRKL